jgi:hypothetical protein
MFNVEDLRALAAMQTAPAVSIYLPTHMAGRETRQDPIRLRNLLHRAIEELQAMGLRRPDADTLLAPATSLLDTERFWRHQQQGLALLAARGFFRCERLPIEVDEAVVVGRRLHLKPLLPLAASGQRFAVLALSVRRARLFMAARFGCAELDVDFPFGVGQITAETEYDNERDAAPQARPRSAGNVGMPASHNAGESPEEQRKAQLIQYLRRVLDVLDKKLRDDPAPVVLVAQPEIQGHARALAKHRDFLEGGVEADPEALDPDELHRRAWELARPVLGAHRRHERERFAALLGAGDAKALTAPRDVVIAARDGRIDTLLLAEGEALWGRVADDDEVIEAHGRQGVADEDLLDLAAVRTLEHGGRIEILPKEDMPPTAELMAAILRF